jgi:hypothetical protein
MKRLLAIFISVHCSLFTVHPLIAQQQIPNPGFEEWEDAGTVIEEPVNWSSIKTGDNPTFNDSAPVVWEQSTDAHSGAYSAKVFCNEALLGIIANGTLTNGQVHAAIPIDLGYVFTNPDDARWHTPFTDRPDSLVFWYKAFPQGNDYGKIRCILHIGEGRMPENGTQDNYVAEAIFYFPNEQVSEWTRVAVPFVYFKAIDPEYILFVLNSGNGTQAVLGSEAYFDDIQLIYNPESISEENTLEGLSITATTDAVTIQIDNPADLSPLQIEIFDITGRSLFRGEENPASLVTCPVTLNQGLYICRVMADKGFYTAKVYIH